MSWLGSLLGGPRLALIHDFQRPPYGGGNQFLLALAGELRAQGLEVGTQRIGPRTRAALFNSFNFEERWEERLARAGVRRVHRVDGPVGAYRGSDDAIDRRIAGINARCADATIFQSRYSLEAHARLGLSFREPAVILNSVDPALFHARGREGYAKGRKLRLITTSWSDNPNKGGPLLQRLERRLDWSRYEYSFVGRVGVEFSRIRLVPPLASVPLAELLRQHDVFVAASLHDPCSNALLEALACGLPAIFRNSGGHPELVGEAGFTFSDEAEIPELLDRLAAEYEDRQRRISIPSLARTAASYRAVLRV